jgi:hypothetical protein
LSDMRKHLSEEHKRKISNTLKGIIPVNFYDIQKLGSEASKKLTGEKSHLWKGNNIGYQGIHGWIRHLKGEAKKCSICGMEKNDIHNIHWANISHKYLRDENDWIQLCVSCHWKFDKPYEKRQRINGMFA